MAITVRKVTDANTAFTSSTELTIDFLELRGTNGPDSKVYQIIQFNGGGGYGWQIALGTDHYSLYKRHCRNGTWTQWVRFWPPLSVRMGGVISKLLLSVMSLGGRHDEYHPEAESAETRHIRMANSAHNPDAYRNISILDHFGFAYDPLSDMGRRYGLLSRWDFLKSGNEQLRFDSRRWRFVGAFCALFPLMAKEVA